VSVSPHWLGADSYIKYFGQYFRYFPLQPPRRKPFTNEIVRPRLVFASGVPLGGEEMLVINNELRFPLVWLFDGVTFLDIGNVFDRVSNFSFLNVRADSGVGLRLHVPWFVVRVDYGIPFNPRLGEPRSRLFISIGQAF